MNIKFELITADHSDVLFTPEEEIFAALEKFSEYLGTGKRVHTGLLVMTNDQGEEISFPDEMWHISMILCFKAAAGLLAGNSYIYKLMVTGQPVQFQPLGDFIEVTNLDGTVVAFPKNDLILGLYHCGGRYLDLMDLLFPLGQAKNTIYIRKFQAEAQKALKEYGLID